MSISISSPGGVDKKTLAGKVDKIKGKGIVSLNETVFGFSSSLKVPKTLEEWNTFLQLPEDNKFVDIYIVLGEQGDGITVYLYGGENLSLRENAFKSNSSIYYFGSKAFSVIRESAFEDSGLINIEIENITEIDPRAFKNCQFDCLINLPNINLVYDEAFSGCLIPLSIIFGQNLTYIADSVFANCPLTANSNCHAPFRFSSINNGVIAAGLQKFIDCGGFISWDKTQLEYISESLSNVENALSNKVDKVDGKFLSTYDYNEAERNRGQIFGEFQLTYWQVGLPAASTGKYLYETSTKGIFYCNATGQWINVSTTAAVYIWVFNNKRYFYCGAGLILCSSEGGLINVSESSFVYNAKNGVALSPNSAQTNLDIALPGPRGNGALMLQVPDGTAANGNSRGQNAIDLQTKRLNGASRVASGNNSVAIGVDNEASGWNSIAIGYQSKATNMNAIALEGVAKGDNSFAVLNGTTNARFGISMGSTAESNCHGEFSRSSGSAESYNLQNQSSDFLYFGATYDAVPKELFLDGISARLSIPYQTVIDCEISIVAKTTGVNCAVFRKHIIMTKGTTAAATQIVLSETMNTEYKYDNNISVAIAADTTNGTLNITVTGVAATTLVWGAIVKTILARKN